MIVAGRWRYPQSFGEPSTITICFGLRHSLKFPQVDSSWLWCHLSNPLLVSRFSRSFRAGSWLGVWSTVSGASHIAASLRGDERKQSRNPESYFDEAG